MKSKIMMTAFVLLHASLISSVALAQGKKPGGTSAALTKKEDGAYGYDFSDDPLAAGGFGPNDVAIRVRTGAVRATLIRPRTSFVSEMLKSVENF